MFECCVFFVICVVGVEIGEDREICVDFEFVLVDFVVFGCYGYDCFVFCCVECF